MISKGFNPQHQCSHQHCFTISHSHQHPPQQHTLNVCMQLDQHTHYNCSQQKNINRTEVDQEEVIDGLLKYNTSLTKYLSKYYRRPENSEAQNERVRAYEEGNDDKIEGKKIDKYVSIVEEKKLNFGVPDNSQLPGKQQQKEQEIKAPQLIEAGQQTSPRNQNPKKMPKKSPKNLPHDQQKLHDYYKKLRQESRYLSDTGFRKHFNRQCFENYGRQNTTGVADGIMYGNYLKTFNINPHTGSNLPQKGETYEHALITASPQKYEEYQRIRSPSKEEANEHRCGKQTINEASHECEEIMHQDLEREDYNLNETITQNMRSHKARDKYNHMKLRKKSNDEEWEEEYQRKIEIPRQKPQRMRQQNNYTKNQKQQISPKLASSPQIIPEKNQQEQGYDAPQIYHNKSPQLIHQEQIQKPLQKPSTGRKLRNVQIYNPPIIERTFYHDTVHTFAGNCFHSPQAAQQLSGQILSRSFTNPNLAHFIIDYASDFTCQICKHRQFTKCCCKNK